MGCDTVSQRSICSIPSGSLSKFGPTGSGSSTRMTCPDLHQGTASPQPHYFCLPQVVCAVGLGYDLGYWSLTISDVRSGCTSGVSLVL